MDKQKQIEEMARFLYNQQKWCDMTNPYEVAQLLINKGYRKIPEGAVVLTKEEKSEIINFLVKRKVQDFAERVKMTFYYEFDELIPSIMSDKIVEICKEITEGKDDESGVGKT